MQHHRMGVVGAGVMGRGVAECLAGSGFDVVLVDRDEAALDGARDTIQRTRRLHALFSSKGGAAGSGSRDGSIHLERSLEALSEASVVIENATESWAVKEAVHARLNRVCQSDAIIGVNTSALSITRVASCWDIPERVVGMHFMNPAPLMPTVEVIRGERTSARVLEATRAVLKAAGKESIIVNDSPGFVTNRVMMQMVNEAVFLLHEGVADAAEIDRLFKTCFGHKMGPLETADLIGLDTVLRSIDVIQDGMGDAKYRACPLLRRMVYAGKVGRKCGEGFYSYHVRSAEQERGNGRIHADG